MPLDLRIMSLNVRTLTYEKLEAFRKAITELQRIGLQPDIICLQETGRTATTIRDTRIDGYAMHAFVRERGDRTRGLTGGGISTSNRTSADNPLASPGMMSHQAAYRDHR